MSNTDKNWKNALEKLNVKGIVLSGELESTKTTGFFTPQEIFEGAIQVFNNIEEKGEFVKPSIVANHLMVLGMSLQMSHKDHFGNGNEFYQDLINLNQKHFPEKSKD